MLEFCTHLARSFLNNNAKHCRQIARALLAAAQICFNQGTSLTLYRVPKSLAQQVFFNRLSRFAQITFVSLKLLAFLIALNIELIQRSVGKIDTNEAASAALTNVFVSCTKCAGSFLNFRFGIKLLLTEKSRIYKLFNHQCCLFVCCCLQSLAPAFCSNVHCNNKLRI